MEILLLVTSVFPGKHDRISPRRGKPGTYLFRIKIIRPAPGSFAYIICFYFGRKLNFRPPTVDGIRDHLDGWFDGVDAHSITKRLPTSIMIFYDDFVIAGTINLDFEVIAEVLIILIPCVRNITSCEVFFLDLYSHFRGRRRTINCGAVDIKWDRFNISFQFVLNRCATS